MIVELRKKRVKIKPDREWCIYGDRVRSMGDFVPSKMDLISMSEAGLRQMKLEGVTHKS